VSSTDRYDNGEVCPPPQRGGVRGIKLSLKKNQMVEIDWKNCSNTYEQGLQDVYANVPF